jgi:CBS domain-containing protein
MALVSESMNRSLVSVSPDASLAEAVAVVQKTGAEHVLVVDEQMLVGILCACELRGARLEDRVAERMSRHVATVRPDVGLEEAAALLRACSLGCLPVAVGGLVLGTLSEAELDRAGVSEPRPRCRQAHRRRARPARA